VGACAYSPDGRRITSGSFDRTLRIWDAESLEEIATLTAHTDTVTTCCYSPDGRRILSGSRDKTLQVWDAETGDEIAMFTPGHPYGVDACCYSPDGRRIVSAGSSDNVLEIRDAETGAEIALLESPSELLVPWFAYSPDGRRLAASGDHTLKVWDARTAVELDPLVGLSEPARAAYSADGNFIVTVSWEDAIQVWDTQRGGVVLRFVDGSFACVAMGGCRSLASGDSKGRAYILDLVGLNPGPAYVTSAYLYRFDHKQYDGQPSAKCGWCGRFFWSPPAVLDVILQITRDTQNLPSLPDEAWDEPHLQSACPHCRAPLRFNPFLVDNRQR
jgi:WD40 repeat protein